MAALLTLALPSVLSAYHDGPGDPLAPQPPLPGDPVVPVPPVPGVPDQPCLPCGCGYWIYESELETCHESGSDPSCAEYSSYSVDSIGSALQGTAEIGNGTSTCDASVSGHCSTGRLLQTWRWVALDGEEGSVAVPLYMTTLDGSVAITGGAARHRLEAGFGAIAAELEYSDSLGHLIQHKDETIYGRGSQASGITITGGVGFFGLDIPLNGSPSSFGHPEYTGIASKIRHDPVERCRTVFQSTMSSAVYCEAQISNDIPGWPDALSIGSMDNYGASVTATTAGATLAEVVLGDCCD